MFKFNQAFHALQYKFIYAWLNGLSKHDALKIVPLRAFHANFTWQNMSASLKRTAPSNTMFATTWSGIQITRSSLQKFFSRGPTLMSLFFRSHASGLTQLYWTTVCKLYNCNHNIAKEIMFYEIYFIKHYIFRYIHDISSFLS